ncbi:hypothetical protein [Kitasatospora sp. NPDC017646]|uniref:hypothetical protein n=1 Tax=Kitasatospora sp. NPDC017646 TaxID=3364024 RepID=UPI00379586DF
MRHERRSGALTHVLELLLVTKVTKVAEEACEAGALYRHSKGWGSDGPVTATTRQAQHEMCAAIMDGLVALYRLCPDDDAAQLWADYLTYGYERALRENTEAA